MDWDFSEKRIRYGVRYSAGGMSVDLHREDDRITRKVVVLGVGYLLSFASLIASVVLVPSALIANTGLGTVGLALGSTLAYIFSHRLSVTLLARKIRTAIRHSSNLSLSENYSSAFLMNYLGPEEHRFEFINAALARARSDFPEQNHIVFLDFDGAVQQPFEELVAPASVQDINPYRWPANAEPSYGQAKIVLAGTAENELPIAFNPEKPAPLVVDLTELNQAVSGLVSKLQPHSDADKIRIVDLLQPKAVNGILTCDLEQWLVRIGSELSDFDDILDEFAAIDLALINLLVKTTPLEPHITSSQSADSPTDTLRELTEQVRNDLVSLGVVPNLNGEITIQNSHVTAIANQVTRKLS